MEHLKFQSRFFSKLGAGHMNFFVNSDDITLGLSETFTRLADGN